MVVWAGIPPSGRLETLEAIVERCCLGFGPAQRFPCNSSVAKSCRQLNGPPTKFQRCTTPKRSTLYQVGTLFNNVLLGPTFLLLLFFLLVERKEVHYRHTVAQVCTFAAQEAKQMPKKTPAHAKALKISACLRCLKVSIVLTRTQLVQHFKVALQGTCPRAVVVVRHIELTGGFLHDLGNLAVVHVANVGEQMVLNLEVEPADQPTEHAAAIGEVGGGFHLVDGPVVFEATGFGFDEFCLFDHVCHLEDQG